MPLVAVALSADDDDADAFEFESSRSSAGVPAGKGVSTKSTCCPAGGGNGEFSSSVVDGGTLLDGRCGMVVYDNERPLLLLLLLRSGTGDSSGIKSVDSPTEDARICESQNHTITQQTESESANLWQMRVW